MKNTNIQSVINDYNKVNNSFDKKVVFHVGDGAGFYSEVNAMMQCMLWCYARQIKFVLYADDANFSGGYGWEEFFEPFCEEDHNRWNHYGNHRFKKKIRDYKNYIPYAVTEFLLRKVSRIDYLTQDIFSTAIDRKVSQVEIVDCDIFGVHGVNFEEFAKLIKYVMRFNEKTRAEIDARITSLCLPESYCSVQIRGGDKTLEYKRLNDVDLIISRVLEDNDGLKNLFVFTDDFSYVSHIREKYKDINVFTLTKENEKGYVNETFQQTKWEEKRDNMIKLFAMVEICLNSDVHYGNEYTCVNQYIQYSRKLDDKKYVSVWTRDESDLLCNC